RYAHWHVPARHTLETWDDIRAYDGTVSLIQPLILPLFNGHSALQLLHGVSFGIGRNARELLREFWRARSPETSDREWKQWLQKGVVADTQAQPVAAAIVDDWTAGLPAQTQPASGLTLQFRVDPAVWDG